ncbi:hypothetical protein P4V41_15520 [Fictibacillus nanhaiensis]|uniref:hypothetical protein n=1 Tax=Fictibacillus nanhaiensis TaxID=742169 RepID=UPI002E202743|nr:hypothetical protein [Fictibacillus nanhaiensis]
MLIGDELRFIGEMSHRSGGELTVRSGYGVTTGGKSLFVGERVTEIRTRTVKDLYLI